MCHHVWGNPLKLSAKRCWIDDEGTDSDELDELDELLDEPDKIGGTPLLEQVEGSSRAQQTNLEPNPVNAWCSYWDLLVLAESKSAFHVWHSGWLHDLHKMAHFDFPNAPAGCSGGIFKMLALFKVAGDLHATWRGAKYPRKDDTVPILPAIQAGGANIIEVGISFSEPITDGLAI
ncbi:hypothetical protein EV401DRAFT_1889595 [Pisolithus croceorrhizus]|nr:hypothetical protein EV401DRAFT_1889595 [Pisolithus croceorrhizus]